MKNWKKHRSTIKAFGMLTLMLFGGVFVAFTESAEQNPDPIAIIKKAEQKMLGKTAYSEIKIDIIRPKWSRSMELKSWSKGTTYSVSMVLAPAKDKGTVFLKRDKEVWNYMPSVERTIKLPPSMMSQSWMGTDLTNDDLVNQSSMETDFTHKYLGKETIGGRLCHKIESIPNEDAAVVWGKIITWIDVKDYIQMKIQFFDEDEELVNTFNASGIKTMGGKTVASILTIIPADKEGQKTILTYNKLQFDQPINDSYFTTSYMKRIK